jgi:hypothetical protein
MAKAIMLGGGVCGLASGLMLARDGHEVTVLERDPSPVPASPERAWESWERGGVSQFRQAHYMQPRGRHVLDAELPDVRDALAEAGAARIDWGRMLPPTIADREPRPVDERLVTLTARRPTLEQAFGRAADAQPGLTVRRGVAAARLETRRNGALQVTGVRTRPAGRTCTCWSSSAPKVLQQQRRDALGRVELHPVGGAVDALVAPAAGDVLGRADHRRLGEVAVAGAPDPERRRGHRRQHERRELRPRCRLAR